jgi:tRNA (5-methylaminomethyl-2-thiouridylate)-methyltransferase
MMWRLFTWLWLSSILVLLLVGTSFNNPGVVVDAFLSITHNHYHYHHDSLIRNDRNHHHGRIIRFRHQQPPPGGVFFAISTSENSNESGEDEDEKTPSVESIQQKLVHYGLAWKQASTSANSALTRVKGCVATVYVSASVDDDDDTVKLIGTSDAIVSRGLLALLADYLSTKGLSQVLVLESTTIAHELGVQAALSPGRNDGLANMLQVVQQQLLRGDEEEEETVTTKQTESTATTAATTTTKTNKPTVALLLSGGVDSSVALRLLQQDGYDVTAFYLKIWLEDELAHLGDCPWEDDVAICHQVCDQAGVPLKIMSLQNEYHETVMQHTLQEAAAGRTPNPDILCNSRVKFGCFLDSIDEEEYEFVASGHYAQLRRNNDDPDRPVALVRAPDPVKDQSYFLCALDQSQLKRLLFPIGHLQKPQVRELADHFELPNRQRPDSQGLCFLGKIKFRDFLESHLGKQQGDIVDAVSGEIIGRHDGVWYHTVGQRKGIGQSLFPLATSRGPWYVVAKDPAQNAVFCSNQYDEEVFTQSRSEFHVENIHWIAGVAPPIIANDGTMNLWLKIRHGPRLVQGTLQVTEDADAGIITLEAKDGGLAPGQYAVFYTEDAECLGGGIISERHWAKFLLDTQNRSSSVEATAS